LQRVEIAGVSVGKYGRAGRSSVGHVLYNENGPDA
jgi:hypothetical protein